MFYPLHGLDCEVPLSKFYEISGGISEEEQTQRSD